MTESSATILIVEDNPDDYEACLTALTQDNNLANPIQWCQSGDEAMDYLERKGKYSDVEGLLPCLVLLDLNLPGLNGKEILDRIKESKDLMHIPVVVMTSSADQADIDTCYRIGANSYVVKPVDLTGFLLAIGRLREYWFKVVVLPKTP